MPLGHRRHPDYQKPPVRQGRILMQLLRELEEQRAAAALTEQVISAHIDAHESLQPLWEDFQARGGSTSEELALWLLDDGWYRKEALIRKKHLKLVASKEAVVVRQKKVERVPLRRRRDENEPPEAA